jgi:hypothetical protein
MECSGCEEEVPVEAEANEPAATVVVATQGSTDVDRDGNFVEDGVLVGQVWSWNTRRLHAGVAGRAGGRGKEWASVKKLAYLSDVIRCETPIAVYLQRVVAAATGGAAAQGSRCGSMDVLVRVAVSPTYWPAEVPS